MAKKSFGLKNFLFSFVIVCIVIYIFQNGNESVKTMVAEKGTLEDIINAQGIVIKDEEVFNASVDGNISYYNNDGEKVNKGLLVADINTDSNAAQIQSQIAELDNAIKLKSTENNGNKENKENKEKSTNQASGTVNDNGDSQKDLQTAILNSDLESMNKIVGQEGNSEAETDAEDKYKDYSISQLESMKKSLSKSIGTNKVPYYSGKSGIITYKVDGLEDIYKYEDVLSLTSSSTVRKEYTEKDSSKNPNVVKGDKLFKIITNFDYYIAVTLNNEYAKLFEENKYVKVRVISNGIESEIWGYIKKINYGSEASVLILYFDDYFYKIYDKRYIDLQLITDIHEGLKIDSKAICEKDGIKGAYVVDISNIVKFFPIEILGQDDKNAVVYEGDFVSESQRKTIAIADKIYETIKIFDKIVLEPDKICEGQIVK